MIRLRFCPLRKMRIPHTIDQIQPTPRSHIVKNCKIPITNCKTLNPLMTAPIIVPNPEKIGIQLMMVRIMFNGGSTVGT